jgi:uncharacterized protein YjbI with pentapeptide repeats
MNMKKIRYRLLCAGVGILLAVLWSCASDDEALQQPTDGQTPATVTRADLVSCTVTKLEAGQLETRLPELVEDVSTVQSLTITGEFSKVDAQYLKENVKNLVVLDLSDVTQLKKLTNYYDETQSKYVDGMVSTDELEWSTFSELPIEEIYLPASIIKTIAGSAFYNCKSLRTISIPSSVTTISDYVFKGCSSLQSVSLPSGLTKIDQAAFEDCTSLKSVTIPSSVTTLVQGAFSGCSSLEKVTLPRLITEIGSRTFYYCSSLTEIELPEAITSIRGEAFEGCTSLKSINMPSSLTLIESEALKDCGFEEITIPQQVTSLGYNVLGENKQLKSLSLLANITQIPSQFCEGCTALTQVILSSTIKSVARAAFNESGLTDFTPFVNLDYSEGDTQFAYCNFESVDLSHINEIRNSMFKGCAKLKEAKLSDQLTKIDDSAFRETALESIEFPNTLKSIGYEAFYGTNLSEIVIPESVTKIGGSAFERTLIATLTVPASVTDVTSSFVNYCPNLIGLFWKSPVEVKNMSQDAKNHTFLYLYTDENGNVPSYESHWDGKVIVDGVAENIVLQPGQDSYTCPQAFTAKKISYSTSFNDFRLHTGYGTSGGWKTIVLPFSPTKISHEEAGVLAPFGSELDDYKPFWLRDLTVDGFVNVTTFEADHPYIISMPYNPDIYLDEYNIYGTVTFEAENVEIKESEMGVKKAGIEGPDFLFYPSYTRMARAGNIYALNWDKDVTGYNRGSVFARSLQEIYPFEGYVMSSSLRSVISLDGTRAVTRGASSTRAGVPGDSRLKQRGVPKVDDM